MEAAPKRITISWSSPFCVGAAASEASEDQDVPQHVAADEPDEAPPQRKLVTAKR